MADPRLLASSGPAYYVSTLESEPFWQLGQDVIAADPDMNVLVLRGKKSRSQQAFFNELGAVLQAPGSFGENWDALSDLLAERGNLPGTVILIPDAEQLFSEDPAQLKTFIEVFDTCTRRYPHPGQFPAQGVGFHVVFQVPPGARTAFEQRLTDAGAQFDRL